MNEENKTKAKNYLIILLAFLCLRSCYNASVHIPITTSTITTTKDLKKKYKGILNIDRKTLGVVEIKTETVVKVKENTVISYDTITLNDTIYVDSMPTYSASFNDKWKTGTIRANKDSIVLNAKFKDYSFLVYSQKRGLFKLQPIETSIKNQNPNTISKGVMNNTIKPKNPLLNVSAQVGGGIDLLTGKPVIYGGVGVGVALVR